MNDIREALQKNSQIILRACADARDEKVFFIEGEISRGSSAICYNAYYFDDDGHKVVGSLKEFYPCDSMSPAFDLSRDNSVDDRHKNQLYSHKGTLENFLRFKQGYKKPYDILSEIRGQTDVYPDAKDLNNYLPSYELYRGLSPDADKPDNCTLYVWVENEPGFVTYAQLLHDVCLAMKDEAYNSMADLSLILRCVAELADAVDVLHMFSLYHLDLKPENFGIATYKDKPKENVGISLYDLNSLYSGRSGADVVVSSGTKYFRSPEVKQGNMYRFGPMSDVYSLGALLYYSLIVAAKDGNNAADVEYRHVHFCEGKNEFDENEYNNIGVNLRNSPFLSGSDETQNSILFRHLYSILQKSLKLDEYRNGIEPYKTAKEFAGDVKVAIDYLKPFEGVAAIEARTAYHVETVLKQKEEHFAAKNKHGAAGAIQWLLYKYPLYNYCLQKEGEEDFCHVLVLGGATYASKFIDLAFEFSQVKNCRLDITVISDRAEADKTAYLATRPAMEDFFEIDRVPAKRVKPEDGPFGRLTFVQEELAHGSKLKAQIDEICARSEDGYTYVFIALGDETRNEEAAFVLDRSLRGREQKSLIGYTVFDESKKTEELSDGKDSASVCLVRLSVFDSPERHKEYEMLRRMAFNVHLMWSPDQINDIPSARAKFRSEYNFNSSLRNAMSIKYKLHSIDSTLEPDNFDPVELAERVAGLIGSMGGGKSRLRELTMYEHRRWIVEKITDSWRTLDDVTQLHTDTKDKANRLHPCIVPSEDPFTLSTTAWQKDKWQTATEEDMKSLDSLDRMSIQMHQHFVCETRKLRNDRRELDRQKQIIEEIASGDAFAASVWDDMNDCINELIDNGLYSAGVTGKYKYYKRLLSGIDFPDGAAQKLSAALKKLDGILFPAFQAAAYKNWKKTDEELIRNIPFILTYSSAFHLCVPFFCESSGAHNTTALFENVASSLMLDPLYVTFIVDGDEALKDMNGFKRSVSYCANILKNHRLQTEINIVLLRGERTVFQPEDKQQLAALPKIHLVDEIVYSNWNQVKALRDYLSQKSKNFTAIEVNETRIGGLLQSANELAVRTDGYAGREGDSGLFPMYTFDSRKRTFYTTKGCTFLRYVHNSPSLLINDLFYSRDKAVDFSEPQLINEHRFLWALYTGNSTEKGMRRICTSAWKELCASIKNYMSKICRIANFPAYQENTEYIENYCVYFPVICRDSMDMIMKALNETDFKPRLFKKNKYKIARVDSSSCRMTVKGIRKDVVKNIERLLMQPTRLADKAMVEIVYMPANIGVNVSSLRVNRLKLSDAYIGRCREILDALQENNGIRSLEYDEENKEVSFTFSTVHYMRLMSNEGNILELHLYREMIASGRFNDVKNSATVFWNSAKTSNEMDVIMVRGFETYIVEAKAVRELKPEYYDKLYPLIKTFGVNSVPIIVADLNGMVNMENNLQIGRGEEMGIRTITNADDPIREMENLKLF